MSQDDIARGMASYANSAAGIASAGGALSSVEAAQPSNPPEGRLYDYAAPAKPVIWDTDWWTDCDDVGAARILVWAEKQGLVDVRAVGLDADFAFSAASLDAVFRADGRPDMVMCRTKTPHVPDGSPGYQRTTAINYPSRCLRNTNLPDAVVTYRTVLAQATRKVDIISVGYLNNLYELLLSPADAISPLTGAQLVAQKCGELWVMGGQYPSGTENNFARTAQAVTAAVYVCANWPTRITFLGYEVGATVVSGTQMFATSPSDIVASAYSLAGQRGGRPSWDPMLTLVACVGDLTAEGYTAVTGTNVVTPGSGANTFTAGAGNHRYLVKAKADGWYAERLNDLLLVATQPAPPHSRRVFLDGRWQNLAMSSRVLGAAQPSALNNLVTATVDVENLSFQVHASDCADAGDGGSIAAIPNRAGRIGFRLPATNGGQATYTANKGGKTAITFAANNFYVTESFRQPLYMTVYAKIWFDTLPVSNQTILSCDTNSGDTTRQFHLKVISGGIPQAVAFSQAQSAATDNGPATITTGGWITVVGRFRESDIEALVGATGSGGATARTAQVCANNGTLTLGRVGTTSEQFIGHLHELRIYKVRHSDAEISAVMADMD